MVSRSQHDSRDTPRLVLQGFPADEGLIATFLSENAIVVLIGPGPRQHVSLAQRLACVLSSRYGPSEASSIA